MDLIYKGIWFLPSSRSFSNGVLSIDDKKSLQGTLTITEEGEYTLETLGVFQDVSVNETFTINGNTTDGMAITLFGCMDFKGPFNSNALVNPNTYKAMQVVVAKNQSENAYLDSIADLNLSSFRFKSHNLSSWLFNNNFIYEGYREYGPGDHIYIKYRLPNEDSGVMLDSGLRIRIVTSVTPSGMSIAETKRSITEDNFIEFSSNNLKVNDANILMSKFLDFLTIAVGETQSRKEVSFTIKGIVFKYYSNVAKRGKEKKIIPQYMFFTYRDIEHQWNDIIKRWFDVYEKMIDSFSLYFSSLSNQIIYLNQKFLLLVQFLESFHRKTNPVDEKEINEWNDELNKIFKDDISKKEIQSYKGKLKYGYEPSLESRLNSMFKSSNIAKSFLVDEKYSVFSNKVAETRNYLTHLGSKTKNVIDDIKELYQVCIKLDKLSRYSILKTLGFADNQMSEITNKFWRFNQTIWSM